jgi:hypothetical protein
VWSNIAAGEWLASDADGDYETLHSFLKEEHFQEFLEKEAHLSEDSRNAEAVRLMFEDAGDLITWMCHLPIFMKQSARFWCTPELPNGAVKTGCA